MKATALALLSFAGLVAGGAAGARAQDQDYYISAQTGIWRLDHVTLKLKRWSWPYSSPAYGEWVNGTLYMPDAGSGEVWKVNTSGFKTLLTSGGYLEWPITAAVEPDGDVWVSDLYTSVVVKVNPAGNQTLVLDASRGLSLGTSGLSWGPDGRLYIGAYLHGDIHAYDPVTDVLSLITDGAGVIQETGGLQVDGSGNVWACDFLGDQVVRVRVEDGSVEVVATDPILVRPNDLKLTKEGRILVTTTHNSALVRIDGDGTTTLIAQNGAIGLWQGVAVPADFPRPTGRLLKYGVGTAGTGGFVPDLRGLLSPSPGATFGFEHRFALGGAPGFLLWGVDEGNLAAFGGTLLVDLGAAFGLFPLFFPGSGPGDGGFVGFGALADDPNLIGAELWFQDLILDTGAPKGIAMSNGLHMVIGE